MSAQASSLRRASLALLGTIIGAGVFALPAVFREVGLRSGSILFWFVAFVALLTHLLFAEICLAHGERRRLPGFAAAELGTWGAPTMFTYPLGIIGANAAYIILGGEFLRAIFQHLGWHSAPFVWQTVLWLGVAAAVYFGLRCVAVIEAKATTLLILSMMATALLAILSAARQLLPAEHWTGATFAFGIFLFSLSGLPIVGEVVDLVQRKAARAYAAIVFGTLGAAFLSWIFGLSLALATSGTSARPPEDLLSALPASWGWIIPVFGFFAVLTSYLTTAQDLKATLHLDFHLPKKASWLVAIGAPYAIFLVLRDFLLVIDLVGAIFLAVDGIFVAFIGYRVLRRARRPESWALLCALLIATFFLALLQKIILFVRL